MKYFTQTSWFELWTTERMLGTNVNPNLLVRGRRPLLIGPLRCSMPKLKTHNYFEQLQSCDLVLRQLIYPTGPSITAIVT